MKIHRAVLARFVDLPPEIVDSPRGLRDLLDDLGIEVKRLDGDVLTLELLANRGDHHAYLGIARELAARLDTPLLCPPLPPLRVVAPARFTVESSLCLSYSLTPLAGTGGAELPAGQRLALEAAGQSGNTAPVDATNLANLELGQPTHAFDADRIRGRVRVRASRPAEQAWLLFTPEPRTLPAGTLVIADDEKILAVAGVIGCEESKTTAETRQILLESATFDPVAVRLASRALGVHTDSAARFERGADPDAVLDGAARVADLLEATGAWARTGPTEFWAAPRPDPAPIHLSGDEVRLFLGLDLPDTQIARVLGALGFAVSPGFSVRVPARRRWDVTRPADLLEEIARIIGYNAGPVALPPVALGSQPTPGERRRDQVDDVLVGLGFYEVITDGFHARALSERLGLPTGHPLAVHVETTNALDRGYSLLKNSGVQQAIEAVATNVRARVLELKLFEWTRAFHPRDPAFDRLGATERPLLWAIATGGDRAATWAGRPRPADTSFVRGLLDELSAELSVPLAAGPIEADHRLAAVLHPHRRGAVRVGDRVIGAFGEIHPAVLASFKIKGVRPVYLEIDADPLLSADSRRPPFHEPPTWHPIERSLAFTLPARFESARVDQVIDLAAPRWLERRWISDRFEHDGLSTLTWTLRFANADNTRTVDEVNAAAERVIAAVVGELGPHGVKLR